MIVMVTNLMEGSKKKCSSYWPEGGDPVNFGPFAVELIDRSILVDFTIRKFTLKVCACVCGGGGEEDTPFLSPHDSVYRLLVCRSIRSGYMYFLIIVVLRLHREMYTLRRIQQSVCL